MAGQIKRMIEQIVEKKARGDQALVYLIQAKLALKGINIQKYDASSEDDPLVIAKLHQIAKDFGVPLR